MARDVPRWMPGISTARRHPEYRLYQNNIKYSHHPNLTAFPSSANGQHCTNHGPANVQIRRCFAKPGCDRRAAACSMCRGSPWPAGVSRGAPCAKRPGHVEKSPVSQPMGARNRATWSAERRGQAPSGRFKAIRAGGGTARGLCASRWSSAISPLFPFFYLIFALFDSGPVPVQHKRPRLLAACIRRRFSPPALPHCRQCLHTSQTVPVP